MNSGILFTHFGNRVSLLLYKCVVASVGKGGKYIPTSMYDFWRVASWYHMLPIGFNFTIHAQTHTHTQSQLQWQ